MNSSDPYHPFFWSTLQLRDRHLRRKSAGQLFVRLGKHEHDVALCGERDAAARQAEHVAIQE